MMLPHRLENETCGFFLQRLFLPFKKIIWSWRYKRRVVVAYMDKVDWDHEVGAALGGNLVFADVDDLKRNSKCLDQCGYVEVEIRLKRTLQESNFTLHSHTETDSLEKSS